MHLRIEAIKRNAEAAETDEERNALLDHAINLENELILLQRQRAREALEQSEHFISASDEERTRILSNFDMITQAMLRVRVESENTALTFGNFVKTHSVQLLDSAIDLYNEIANAATAVLKKETERQNKILDDQYKKNKERLDKELQDRLYMMGYIEAATEAQHEHELQLAIESGDQQRAFAAHSAYERFKIEEEYAEKQKELEEKLKREKAELEFKAEMAAWKMKRISLIASTAQAIVQALSAPPGWPWNAAFVTAATAMGVAQGVVLDQAKPELRFEGGGIVPGNSYTGDKIKAGVNSREMWLNMEQQGNLFNAIKNNQIGGGEAKTVVIPIYLDKTVISKAVVSDINDRKYLIKQASVV